MRKSMTFNNIRKPWLHLLEGRQKSPFAPVRNNLIRVTGMPGAYVGSKETDVLYITQPVGFIVNDDAHAVQLIDELSAGLNTSEAVPLEFDDEPGRIYYAELEGTIEEFSRFVDQRRGVITFLCVDPFSYGPEKEYELPDVGTIKNKGTAEADPIFTMDVQQPTTFAMVSNGDEYMMIGRPFDIGEIPTEKYPEVARWQMDNLLPWSHMTDGALLNDEVTGGIVSGSSFSIQNGSSFVPSTYGTVRPGAWYGPAVRRSLPKDVKDFSITFGVEANNNGKGLGKVMAIFLDDQDKIVCSIGLINTRHGTKNMRVLARLNDGKNISRRRVFDYTGDSGPNSTVFNNRSINIRLRREGNKFEAYTWQVRDGVQHARHGETIIDDNPDFQRPIRQVVLYFGKYGSNPVFPMRIYGLRVHDSNTLEDFEIPYIADTGDIITFDHKTGDCFVNGEPVPFDFGGDFFKLKEGENTLAIMPENTFETSVKFRPPYR